MRENKLRRILEENGSSIATRISSRWATITELAAYAGCYDYIEYLAEYAPLPWRTMRIWPAPANFMIWAPSSR